MRDETPMRVLLVCDAGAAVGLGHWSRTGAVSSALRERGVETKRLVFGEQPDGRERFAEATLRPGDADFSAEVLRVAAEWSPQAIVFDLHPRRANAAITPLLRALSEGGTRVVGIDSLRGQADALDLLCIPSFYVEPQLLAAHAAKLVWGWDSILVEARFPLREWAPGNRLLVLTGGSDTTGLSASLPALLDARLAAGARVDWVRGPYALSPAIPEHPRLDWTVHHAPAGLDALMAQASHALTVFGVSLLELLKYGIPSVVFSPYGGANDVELQVLRQTGACIVADDAADAVVRLAGLARDDDAARACARESRRLLAGAGPGRLVQRIVELVA